MTKSSLFQKGLAFFACLFLFAGAVFAQTTKSVTFSSNGSWQVPTTFEGNPIIVTSVTIEAWGGGGAGGFCEARAGLDPRLSGGGGGGAYGKTVISDPVAEETFNITVGEGGYYKAESDGILVWQYKNLQFSHGGQTVVKRGSTTVLEANGGQTCAMNTETGALGGTATGAGDMHKAGGKGGDAKTDCILPGNRASGGGGGAGYAGGNGGNGGNGICNASNGGGAGGTSGGNGGNGGKGVSDIGVGGIGGSFGGGGAGSKSGEAWHSGGAGGKGGVKITYTYIAEEVAVNNAETTICSGATYDVALDITPTGFTLDQLTVPTDIKIIMTDVMGLEIGSVVPSYNTLDSKWHLISSATNTTSNTLFFNINVTVFTPNHLTSATATVKVNVYGKLDGGIIAEDQLVCQGQTIQTLTSVTDATGGSGIGGYQWWQWVEIDENGYSGSNTWEQISGANSSTYTPMLSGLRYFARQYKDNVCGNVYATDGAGSQYLNVTTVDPYTFMGGWSSDDTICSTVSSYTKTLEWAAYTPAYLASYGQYWQKSTDKGTTWTNLAPGFVSGYSPYSLTLNSSDLTAGSDLWYRAAVKTSDCDSIPSNEIYKIHVKEVADYTTQFPDVNITLWYGACDTSIANLTAPTLDPTPVSIVRVDGLDRVPAGEHNILWKVNDGCSESTFTQKVTVTYPACGTTVTDANGREYQTVRVGCDCWIAENLKTNAEGAVYYNEDNANEGFGLLYDWNAAVGSNNTEQTCKTGTYIQGICPDGWAIPTVAKFNNMLAEVGDIEALKSDDETTWLPGNAGTNTSGFGAKGAGYYEAMQYQRQLGYTYFWTCELNPSNSLVARTVELRCGCGEFTVYDKSKESKVSVRCVKVELND